MSVVSVKARSFILALFIRDDGERFLLGDNGYDFKDSQLHFVANTIENDEVMKQGADGVIVAGQVRRASVQSFDGYVGDATMAKETIEQMRRDFFAFFVKGHHFRVIYIDCNRNAWQRKGGYLVDAPEVKELWQIHPEYHVGLNFEDVNYYSYDEDADGNEILANLLDVPVSTAVAGGLVWDEDGAVSEDAVVDHDAETAGAQGKSVYINDAAEAPLASFKLDGETSQNGTPTPSAPVAVNTTTGENVVKITGKNLLPNRMTSRTIAGAVQNTVNSDGSFTLNGTANSGANVDYNHEVGYYVHLEQGKTYTLSVNNAGIYWRLRKVSENTNIATIDSPSTSLTFTAGATEDAFLYFVILNNSSFSSTNYKVQLELGSTATAYEPYQGQSYEANLGKNLFNKDTMTLSNVSINPNINSANGFTSVYIPCEPNTIYTVQKAQETTRFYVVTTEEIPAPGVQGTAISSSTSGTVKTFTTGASARYIAVMVRSTSDTLTEAEVVAGIQIEKGSTATSYANYFTPIELCKIGDYQDYIWNDNGTWKKHKAVEKIALSSLTGWGRSENGKFFFSGFASTYGVVAGDGYSDQFDYSGTAWSSDYRFGITSAGNLWIATGDSTLTSTDLFDTWLDNHNPVAYFQFATPTDTEITNQALIAQLNALLTTARTYAGINNIFTITPNEQGTLEVGYYTKYQPIVTGGGYVWEAGGSGGPTTVMNNSIDNVSPIWTIYGPTQNPQLENTTTGETIEYVGVIADGQTLVVDMGEQTASLDGLNVISNLVGDFIQLAPGANRLIYTVTGDAGASQIGWSEIVG